MWRLASSVWPHAAGGATEAAEEKLMCADGGGGLTHKQDGVCVGEVLGTFPLQAPVDPHD